MSVLKLQQTSKRGVANAEKLVKPVPTAEPSAVLLSILHGILCITAQSTATCSSSHEHEQPLRSTVELPLRLPYVPTPIPENFTP